MLGSLIGAGLGVASSIFGGISARKARRKQERMLAQQEKENQAWYDRKYNEDPTKRADTVRLLTQMQEQIKNRNNAAKGRQAVMGGTEDSTTAVKEANNKTLADTTSQIVAANESRKDAIEGQYQARKDAIQNKRMGLEAEKATSLLSRRSFVSCVPTSLETLGMILWLHGTNASRRIRSAPSSRCWSLIVRSCRPSLSKISVR